jgi:hypothetical protein
MKYASLSRPAAIICEGSDLKHPERWVAEQLQRGRFRGRKIGQRWVMTDRDIAAAVETLYAEHQPVPNPEPEPTPPLSVADGLSARSRRRLKNAS